MSKSDVIILVVHIKPVFNNVSKELMLLWIQWYVLSAQKVFHAQLMVLLLQSVVKMVRIKMNQSQLNVLNVLLVFNVQMWIKHQHLVQVDLTVY